MALSLYQAALDITSDALMAGDLDTMTDRIKLPFRMVTLNSDMIIETEEDLRNGCSGFGQSLLALGVNQFIRLASEAEFLSVDYIQGFHVTHALRNGKRAMPSYSNRMVLQRVGDIWKMIEADSAILTNKWPIVQMGVPESRSDLMTYLADETDIRRTESEPIALYQAFLDRLSDCTVSGDFEGYCAQCSFPYTNHTERADTVISTPAEVLPFFEMLTSLFASTGADRFERQADQAEFLSANQICGYHTTRMYRGSEVVLGPIKSRMILQRSGTVWRLKSVTNSVANDQFPYAEPEPSSCLVTIRQIQERTRR